MENVEIDPMRVLAIIREENPLVLDLAMRRARIEQLETEAAEMRAALVAPLEEMGG